MKQDRRIRRARRWAFIAIAALILGVVATRPNAASEVQDQFYKHTAECLYWFVTDMERHDAECIGDFDSSTARTGTSSVGTGTYTPPPPPTPSPPPPPSDDCGSSGPTAVAFIAPAGVTVPPPPLTDCPRDTHGIAGFALGFFDQVIDI